MISIIDYGCGNLHSLEYAIKAIGLESKVTRDRSEILSSSGAILPGVGAFGAAMDNIKTFNLDKTICDFERSGKKLMGVCLGMHLLATCSNEFGKHKGLGVFSGEVVKLKKNTLSKIPNVGWCQTELKNNQDEKQPIENFFYYTHSFEFVPPDFKYVHAFAIHGNRKIVAALRKKNVLATQFHPEKSGAAGLEILKEFFIDS